MVRKRSAKGSACDTAIQKRRKQLCSADIRLEECRKEVERIEQQLGSCDGPRNILRHKVLTARLSQKRKEMDTIEHNTDEQQMHQLISQIDALEKQEVPQTNNNKVIPTPNRLFPPTGKKQNVLGISAKKDHQWQTIRAHKKRLSLLFDRDIAERKNVIDTCIDCGVDMVVEKDTARMVCPACGDVRQFESHIFDVKDVDSDEGAQTRSQSLTHMQKFMAQFERGYPCASMSVLESLYIEYSRFHFHDPAKVQSCTTGKLMKNCNDIHRIYKRAPERISKELKAEGVPEYSQEETAQILNQRNRLRLPEEIHDLQSKNKKSYCNQIYLRQFGKSNDMPQSGLFTQAKTVKIHLERCRSLEAECIIQKEKQRRLGITSADAQAQWNLRPWS